ncbi:hypothetical protein DYB34_007510 [Aphanomyces astaci]|uniref:Kinesin motor domain-containing protein n=2 Tax=Aphanomyces astaci TaxID=112090 RepID=A0A397B266_APHAT|nr:hypothetical protein DYB36_003595 [Aphanomyces astaci]RHY73823.1 hypothetical protein DYB34_007510 [Aphanomyces astaci]
MKVVVRVRPMIPSEAKKGSTCCVKVVRASSCKPHQVQVDDHLFDVDLVYDERLNQRDLFYKEFANLIPTVFDGTNVTVFASGASGSGKTHTMEGTAKNPGVVPRTMQKVFQFGQQQVATYRVEMSFVEIHNDKVMDFLAATTTKLHQDELSLSTSASGRVVVDGLITRHIASFADFEALYERACKFRRKGAATYHAKSSRSHSLLHVRVESRGFDGLVRVGHLHLIDLAGHDDICPTVQESASMMLDMQPLDESPVARLLADSVAHSSIAVMVCTISPASVVVKDTLEALQCAAKQRHVVVASPTAAPKEGIKHLLTMAVDFEKRGKARPALALYRQATLLLDTPNEKLQARMQALAAAMSTPESEVDGSKRPLHATVQRILEEDILHTFNHGSMAALMALQSIGEKKAAKIIKGRENRVHFTSIRDLMNVGMGEKQVVRFQQLNVAARLSSL